MHAIRDSVSFYISVSFSQHVVSIPKVISWPKMAAGAPAIKTTIQAIRRKNEQKGLNSQLSQLFKISWKFHATFPLTLVRPQVTWAYLATREARKCS